MFKQYVFIASSSLPTLCPNLLISHCGTERTLLSLFLQHPPSLITLPMSIFQYNYIIILIRLIVFTLLLISKHHSQGASLVAQMVKSLPAMQETQIHSWGQEDPLQKERGTPSSILAWVIP